jgi:regulator of protease activity HflC (stomatin/prohibitin superfamily)
VTPVFVVPVYEGAAVLRFGRLHRTLGPGLWFKWPLAEIADTQVTAMTTMRLPAQSLTTRDDKAVVVGAVIKYQLKDVGAYIAQVFDQKDVLADVTMGALAGVVGDADYADLRDLERVGAKVRGKVSREVGKYGFDVLSVTLTDFGRVRSLRLIQAHPKDLEN